MRLEFGDAVKGEGILARASVRWHMAGCTMKVCIEREERYWFNVGVHALSDASTSVQRDLVGVVG